MNTGLSGPHSALARVRHSIPAAARDVSPESFQGFLSASKVKPVQFSGGTSEAGFPMEWEIRAEAERTPHNPEFICGVSVSGGEAEAGITTS